MPSTETAVTGSESNIRYDLFISYRRKDGQPFARWLRQKLLTYRLPRALGDRSKLKLRVYQDTAYERATEDFWNNTVLPALLASRYLGVVLTPGALEARGDGEPNWVQREIEAFTATPQGGNVFVLRGIDCAGENLPGDLHTRFPNIEQIDLRDLQSAWNRLRKRSTLRDRLLTVAATLYDVLPEEMPVFRREEKKRKRRLAWGAALISLVLLAVTIGWLFQRNQARRERNLAEARQLATQSTLLLSDDPSQIERSLLLAVESMRRAPLFENDAAIRRELELLAKPLAIQTTTNSYNAAFAPDSRVVVVSTGDNIARLLELPSGKELLRFDHPSPVIAFALSPDGHYLATSCAQCNVRVFDTSSGKVTTQFSDLLGSPTLAFSPDGRQFAAGGKDNSVHVLETFGWKQVLNLKQPDAITSIKYSPDGSTILVRSDAAHIFDAANGRQLILSEDAIDLPSIDLGPARQHLTVFRGAHVIDATTGKDRAVMVKEAARAAAFSPDGNSIVACGGMPGGDKTCWIFGLPGLGALRSLPPHRDVVQAITYSPDSRLIATSSAGIIRVFEAATGNEVTRILNQKPQTSLLFSPDSRYLAVDLEGEHSRIYAVFGDHLLTVPNKGLAHVALSADGRYLARAGNLQVFEISSGNQLLPGDQSAYAVALSSQGEYLASAQSRSGFSVLNLQNNQEMLRKEDGGMFPRLAFSSNADHLATGFGGVAKVLELPGGKEIKEFSGSGRVLSLAFSADASKLAIGTDKRVAVVYDLANGQEIFRVKHGTNVHAVAFSPDGRYFASGSFDKIVLVHDVSTHNEAFRLNHEETVFAIAFSPDSRFIATGGRDKTARIFDVSTKGEVARFTSSGEIRELMFSPDGKYLTVASGDRDQNIIVSRYPLRPKELMDEACSVLSRNLTPEESKQYLGQDIPPKTCDRP